MRVSFAVAAVALMVVAFAGTAQATSLVVNDPSFENLAVTATDTPIVTGYVNGSGKWVSGNDFLNNGNFSGKWGQVNGAPDDVAVTWQPTAGSFNAGVSIPDGTQVLASYPAASYPDPAFGGEVGIIQTLNKANPVLGYLQPDMAYTVTLDVGWSLGGNPDVTNFQGVYPGFVDPDAGGELGNASFDGFSGPRGTFEEVSYTLYSNDVIDYDSINPGDRLAVMVDFGGYGAVIDNVRVTAEAVSVPEPSTLVLLAAGMIGLLAYAWRKRK